MNPESASLFALPTIVCWGFLRASVDTVDGISSMSGAFKAD